MASFLYSYVCANRIIRGARNVEELRIRHTSLAPDRFVEQAQPALVAMSARNPSSRRSVTPGPPALDDSVPGILRADALIIPLLTEFQGVLAFQDMLEYLSATRDKHPALQIIGILPTRFIRRWQPQEAFLREIRSLGEQFSVYVFDPIPESKAVMTFSMTGRLWRPVANRIIQVMTETPPRG